MLGRVNHIAIAVPDLGGDAVRPLLEDMPSGFDTLSAIRHSAILSKTPAFWARPAMPLGSHPPVWPDRPG